MENRKLPRVLYAIVLDPTQKFGSLEEQIVILSRIFESNGSLFLPLFICPEQANASVSSAADTAGLRLDLRFFDWSKLMRLSAIIRKHRVSILHWNFTNPFRNSYLWCLMLLHPKVAHWYTDHISHPTAGLDSSSGPKKLVKRWLWHAYDRVISVSQFVGDHLRNVQSCSDPVLCRHFVNTQRFRPDVENRHQLRAAYGVEDRFVVLIVAHLIEKKGVHVAVRSMAELPGQVVLWIVGEGAEQRELARLSAEVGVSDRIRFFGLQKDVAPFMRAADCFVCPSLWEEAAGLVNLEAIASGLPVIASRVGGIPEYVEDGRTGLFFEAGDFHGLARCVRRLLDDSALCREMSTEARTQAVVRFSADVRVNDYLELYRTERANTFRHGGS
jgi:glycosyltransferase involved in cell wall biosynthesis